MQPWLMWKRPTLDLMDELLRTLFILLFHLLKDSMRNLLLSFIPTFQQVPDGSSPADVAHPRTDARRKMTHTHTLPTRLGTWTSFLNQ